MRLCNIQEPEARTCPRLVGRATGSCSPASRGGLPALATPSFTRPARLCACGHDRCAGWGRGCAGGAGWAGPCGVAYWRVGRGNGRSRGGQQVQGGTGGSQCGQESPSLCHCYLSSIACRSITTTSAAQLLMHMGACGCAQPASLQLAPPAPVNAGHSSATGLVSRAKAKGQPES